jgi:hypothetical protein
MKRCRFGVALLVLLLAAGISVTYLMRKFHIPVAQDLEQAAVYAENAQWTQASQYTASARIQWEQHRKFSAAFADHEPMEEIDRLFAELEIWLQAEDAEHCASICAQLSQAAQAIKDAHAFVWWNLL